MTVLVIVLLGLARSAWSTRLDGFTLDEGWHVVAGVSYQQSGAFWLNPEHPPLVKRWLGALAGGELLLPELPSLRDKAEERAFIGRVLSQPGQLEQAQQSVRPAMLAFHGLLLIALAFAWRRVFGPWLAAAALVLLLIDPSVCAHLPLAMTDLPVALLAALTVSLASWAFRSWAWPALVLLALSLGLTLGAKHSGVLCAAVVAGGGLWACLRAESGRARKLGALTVVLLGAHLILCACYFTPREAAASSTGSEPSASAYNRALQQKIADLDSPAHRAMVSALHASQLWPDPYVWGLADVLRVGVEGRHAHLLVFGQLQEGRMPWYFFPAVLSVKLPLGMQVLLLLGLALLLPAARARWLASGAHSPQPAEQRVAAALLSSWCGGYLLSLLLGNSGYAGVRHALPVLPGMALLAALPLGVLGSALRARRWPARPPLAALSLLALLGLAWSALPVSRPWEYYNELVGGPNGAWRFFNDEGLDLGQRSRELAAYYDAHVRGSGERAYDYYGMAEEEQAGRGITFNAIEDEALDSELLTGTIFLTAGELPPNPLYDYAEFRARPPAARFGNLLIFRGSYRLPWLKLSRRLVLAERALSADPPDRQRAAQLLREAAALSPAHYDVAFELGNVLLELGDRAGAIAAYEAALAAAPARHVSVPDLQRQLRELRQPGLALSHPLRSPWLE